MENGNTNLILNSDIIIREKRNGEEKQILKVARKAFHSIEALFVSKPKTAMVAEYDGKIVGGMIYSIIECNNKTVAYIDEAFVDSDYQGLGIGKKLYSTTFEYLWAQNCDVITAMVKDDNIASWKLVRDNNFKRVSFLQIIKEIGVSVLIKHFFKTPFLIAVGMDFYMADKENSIRDKRNSPLQILAFFLFNLILLLPLWIKLYIKSESDFLWSLLSYITILLLFIGCRYIGKITGKNKWDFRLNNGGAFLPLLLSLFGNTFLINGNWYPEKYENNKSFTQKLAIPELIKWLVFSLLVLLGFIQNSYCRILSNLACYYSVFMIIPIYPFESFGGGRIYRYNKKLWLILFIITISELVSIYALAG